MTQLDRDNLSSCGKEGAKRCVCADEGVLWRNDQGGMATWVESMVHFEVDQVRKALPQQQPVHGGFPTHVTVTVSGLAVPTATVLQAELVHVL